MNANLILKEEVFAIVGCAMEVLNVLGHGLHEKVYENGLCVEFGLRRISYGQQQRHLVKYKGQVVGEYIPDLVVLGKVVVDAKTVDRITDHERGQLLNYLRITGLPVGVILNFKHSRLECERLVLTGDPRIDSDPESSGDDLEL